MDDDPPDLVPAAPTLWDLAVVLLGYAALYVLFALFGRSPPRGEAMYVSCDKCKYDSGDFESTEELAAKIEKDGGKATATPQGFDATCPNGHSGDAIHLD